MLLKHLVTSLREPAFWAYSSWLGIVTNYRRSRLGMLWLLAPPNIYVWGVGGFFASMHGKPLSEFAAHVAIGVVLFRLLTSVVTEATSVLAANQAFILDSRVRLTDFALRVLARGLFYFGIALPVVAIALWLHPDVQPSGFAYLLLSFPLILLNAVWVGVVFSLIGARFPDIEQFIGNVFLFMFLLTPIIWYAEQAPVDSIRGMLMRLNPLFHTIEVIRAPILNEPLELLSIQVVCGMTIGGWALAAFLYRRYARFVPLWV